jgi:DNA primase
MEEKTRLLLTDVLEESRKHIDKIDDYVQKRNLKNVLDKFQIGFIPNTKTILNCLKEKWDIKESLDILLKTKILFNKNDKYSSFLSGRIIFPIFDVYGRIIALSGRTLTDQKPKYFNTVFSKRRHLYGLNLAAQSILELNYVVIVEGYMDVISAHRIGITNVVAVMGTALSNDHTFLLSRYTKNAFLLLDNDEAGNASMQKYIKTVSPNPLALQVQARSIPGESKDLDEFINEDDYFARKFLKEEILESDI